MGGYNLGLKEQRRRHKLDEVSRAIEICMKVWRTSSIIRSVGDEWRVLVLSLNGHLSTLSLSKFHPFKERRFASHSKVKKSAREEISLPLYSKGRRIGWWNIENHEKRVCASWISPPPAKHLWKFLLLFYFNCPPPHHHTRDALLWCCVSASSTSAAAFGEWRR